MKHIPVLLEEVLTGLHPKDGEVFVDATLGAGGHAAELLKAANISLIGFDRDARNLAIAKERLQEFEGRVTFINDSFANLKQHSIKQIDGALFDLGFSSMHVDEADRGFSFQNDGPLDMRYDLSQNVTAETVVNGYSKEDLADVLHVYGEEPKAHIIAKAIFEARKKQRITTTKALADVVESVVKRTGKAHPATRVFQALRIEVNEELDHVQVGITAAIESLNPGGRLAVITFHSVEDRLVKHLLKQRTDLTLTPKRAIQPAWEEKKHNPRARSAKLRVATKNEGV